MNTLADVLETCATLLTATARQMREQEKKDSEPAPVPQEPQRQEEGWLTTDEIRKQLKISRPTLLRWRKEGKVEYRQFSSQSVRYRLPKP